VTSIPAGATITIGGKVVGITPTSIKVTAFASTMITLTKDGYTPDTQKIALRQNNAAHHVVLKHVTKKLR
jgi:PEGA domain